MLEFINGDATLRKLAHFNLFETAITFLPQEHIFENPFRRRQAQYFDSQLCSDTITHLRKCWFGKSAKGQTDLDVLLA